MEDKELRTGDEARTEHQHRSIRRNLGQQRIKTVSKIIRTVAPF